MSSDENCKNVCLLVSIPLSFAGVDFKFQRGVSGVCGEMSTVEMWVSTLDSEFWMIMLISFKALLAGIWNSFVPLMAKDKGIR